MKPLSLFFQNLSLLLQDSLFATKGDNRPNCGDDGSGRFSVSLPWFVFRFGPLLYHYGRCSRLMVKGTFTVACEYRPRIGLRISGVFTPPPAGVNTSSLCRGKASIFRLPFSRPQCICLCPTALPLCQTGYTRLLRWPYRPCPTPR